MTITMAKLSCNHTVPVGPESLPGLVAGEKYGCSRCPAKANGAMAMRTVKVLKVDGTDVAQVEQVLQARKDADEISRTAVPQLVPPAETPLAAEAVRGHLDIVRNALEDDTPAKTVDSDGALLDRNDRRNAAKFEAKQLAEWRKLGDEQVQRPATPNLDRLEREAKENRKPNGAKATPAKAGKATKAPRATTALNAQTKEARDACGGKRGPGTKVTAEELAKVAADYRATHPEATSASCMEHAYYVLKLAFSRKSWVTAWGN